MDNKQPLGLDRARRKAEELLKDKEKAGRMVDPPPSMHSNSDLKINHLLFLIAMSVAVFLTVVKSTVDHTVSDPQGSLLLSQSISRNLTVKLDSYFDSYESAQEKYSYKVQEKNGHIYYHYPVGTPLFSVPFVLISNSLGYDMFSDEGPTQKVIAAILAVAIFLLLFFLARLYLNTSSSIVVSSVFWFGTGLSSTLGAALWSHDFATFFSLFAILLTLTAHENHQRPKWGFIAFFLFSAYLCRPTFSLLSPPIVLIIFTFNEKAAIKTAATVGGFLVIFIIFSWTEFYQLLPDYYLPRKLSGGHFIEAFLGSLISPARGLFIFSPFMLFPLFFFKKSWRILSENKALLILLAWPLLHLITISKFPMWWGGHSYGPRLMLDILPAIYVILVIIYSEIDKKSKAFNIVIAVAVAFSIYVNTYQGLFNLNTARWNAEPSIDQYPEYLWDWKYPQFLHSEERHKNRLLEHNQNQ
ncbi:MAG: glycosyltransferase family 39 protein [Thermodesulfobacteriota bacterium]